MKHIYRFIKQDIIQHLQPGKVVVLYGPRQVGKTTLIKEIIRDTGQEHLFVNGEDIGVSEWLSSQSIDILRKNIGRKKFLIIDEAQKIRQIGLNLKLIVDHIEDVKVIATGSSSFDLANQVGEPLVGRKWTYRLYPVSQVELQEQESLLETKNALSDRLIYGSYPEIIMADGLEEKARALNEIVSAYLYKDVFAYMGIKKSDKIHGLLKKIAFQIGREVSLNELGNSLNMDSRTIESYLDVLEKSFIVKRVFGFSRNLRKEITKTSRYYFLDIGIRNAVIGNFNDLDSRDDIGMLWENYIVMERMKKREYKKIYANQYFWRTYNKKEIDLIEEREGRLFGYEIKWRQDKRRPPREWLETYTDAEYKVINRDNYLEFIL